MKNKASRRSNLFIFVFIIGIIAMALLLFVSVVQKFSPIILGSEAVVMLCLIFLLSSTMSSRRRIIDEERERAKSPYGNVDKKEIDKIFELIDKEEKRRGRSLAFLAGSESKMAADKSAESTEAKPEQDSTPAESAPSSSPEEEEEDEDKLPIIFPDQDEYEGDSKPFSPISEERAAARKLEKENREKESENAQAEGENGSSADEIADLVAAASMGAAVNELSQDTADDTAMPDERKKGKRGKGGKNMDNRPKKRQPVYYDQYGNPIPAPARPAPAQPVGYDQYGRPIYAQRPPQRKPHPIGFDQNGRPIYPPPQRKPRTPIGYDQYGRPMYAPAPGGRPRPAGARPPQGQRRRPAPGAPGAEQAAAAPVQQIPTEPMAASAADALAALEATQAAGGNQYYDEDYIPVVVHTEEDFEYADDRYTPRIRADFDNSSPVPAAVPVAAAGMAAAVTSIADEYNSSGNGTYRPDYANEDIPVVVPVFEDMEVDYTASRGFTPMNDPYAQKGYAPPVYNPEPVRETPLAPTPIYQDPTRANPEYNAKSAADYTRDDDEDHFIFVPHFDDDDPIPEKPAEPEAPAIPHWKLAKMRRRKVTRRSRRGMLFKVKDTKFADYMQALKSN